MVKLRVAPSSVMVASTPVPDATAVFETALAFALPTVDITFIVTLAFAVAWICKGKATGHGQCKGQRNRHELRTL